MQAFHITETRAIVPVTRKLTQLRYTLDDLVSPAAVEESEEKETRGRRLSARRLGQIIPNAVLQCQKASSEFIELALTYDRKIRVPEYIARERRIRTLTYTATSDILWRPETGFCFVLDVPRQAINAVTWLLSAAVLGYPGRLSTYELDRSRMQHVINFLTKSLQGGPGELVRAVFREIDLEGIPLDEINLRARDLNKVKLYRDVLRGAGHIHAISFLTPIIDNIGRSLSCRMDSRGSVQVYAQRLSDTERRSLLLFFEGMLAK